MTTTSCKIAPQSGRYAVGMNNDIGRRMSSVVNGNAA